MAFIAGLKLAGDDNTYNIRRLQWSIRQQKDQLGRPNAVVHGGQIQVELASMPDELVEWMFQPRKLLDGTIQILRDDTKETLKTITFTNAFCVLLKGSFVPNGPVTSLTRSLLISAQQLVVEGEEQVRVRNNWPS